MSKVYLRQAPVKATMPIQVPSTHDLQARAQVTTNMQGMMGQFIAELLANGKPIVVQLSVEGQPNVKADGFDYYLLQIGWAEADDIGMESSMDRQFATRCLKCGDYNMGEHACHPTLSPVQSGAVARSDETKQ